MTQFPTFYTYIFYTLHRLLELSTYIGQVTWVFYSQWTGDPSYLLTLDRWPDSSTYTGQVTWVFYLHWTGDPTFLLTLYRWPDISTYTGQMTWHFYLHWTGDPSSPRHRFQEGGGQTWWGSLWSRSDRGECPACYSWTPALQRREDGRCGPGRSACHHAASTNHHKHCSTHRQINR